MACSAPVCPKCSVECVERTSQSAKNPGKHYWSCTSCGGWNSWVNPRATLLSSAGPLCRCTQASIRRITKEGRPFWTCASTGQSKCRYFQWCDEVPSGGQAGPSSTPTYGGNRPVLPFSPSTFTSPTKAVAGSRTADADLFWSDYFEFVDKDASSQPPGSQPPGSQPQSSQPQSLQPLGLSTPQRRRVPTPLQIGSLRGSVEFAVDEQTRRCLQRLFETYDRRDQLGVGRDVSGQCASYDSLHVVYAWRVANPTAKARYETRRAAIASTGPHEPAPLDPDPERRAACAELLAGGGM
mmetsp:Transcript_14244/g.36230  ORF Transcript_14244/g.36230 Transcript_14244/m.36230 type:complete len:296 (+) Transcript_14244:117-1004(+)